MNFDFFMGKVKKGIELKFGDVVEVKINEVIKNNGCCLHGVTIAEKDKNISPTIYIDDMYLEYLEGTPLKEIVENISEIYNKSKLDGNINMDFFLHYENVKDRIVYKLIDYNRNRELLERIPHMPFLNLAIVFYYIIKQGTFGNATILIQNTHCKIWNQNTEELYKAACENTPKILPVQIKGMEEIIYEMMEKQTGEEKSQLAEKIKEEVQEIPYERKMYVLSNNQKMQGASALLYPDVLQDFSKALGKGFYILPSSIHEVILVPEVGDEEPKLMEAMVCEINETQLDLEEVLSDKVYYYSWESKALCLC